VANKLDIINTVEYKIHLKETINVSDSLLTTKEYYQKYPRLIILNIIIILLSSLLGLYLRGVTGIIVGIVIGILSFLYLPSGITKVREIYKH